MAPTPKTELVDFKDDPRACPKCQSNMGGLRWCRGTGAEDPAGNKVECTLGIEGEHLHSTCGRCSYEEGMKTAS